MTVSVAMAVYNGEKYLEEQIDSILAQLGSDDELVISYNLSSDRTEEIIRGYESTDSRVRVTECGKKGVIPNFENAIRSCRGDIIFLSDQDDVWVEGKVRRQLELLKRPHVGGVIHGCKYIDSDGNIMARQPRRTGSRYIDIAEILVKNPVQGSTLAFRRELAESFLPFPADIPMHDSWIGLNICRRSRLVYIDVPLLLYRQHSSNVTSRTHQAPAKMLRDRAALIRELVIAASTKRHGQ